MLSMVQAVRRLRFLKRFARTYWRESRAADPHRLPAWRRAADIAAGYHPLEADWYRQLRQGAGGCVTNFDREENLRLMNRHYGYVLDDKAVFWAMARGLPVPPVCVRAVGGVWRWEEGGEATLAAGLSRHGRFVVKPTLGKKGADVRVLCRLDELSPAPDHDAVGTPFVRQHAYAEAIFPSALNTIRLLMLRDDEGAFAGAATHRFGSEATGVTDNFSRGGLVAGIDLQTGRLARALAVGPGNALVEHATHPDTGQRIEGVVVPGWPRLLELAAELGEAFPYLIYVGWDIAVTEGGPVVIEGNSHPSLRFFQLFERLLDRPRLRRFFARHLPVERRLGR
jgi:hypothetical protein